MNYRYILLISTALSITCLFVPFVWMEVGPLGHQYYGPTVPDVYIYGGLITGKDMSFWGIRFAWGFQLFFILVFAVLSFVSLFLKKRYAVVLILFFQLLLLVLFPIWLEAYIQGVVCNSDAADLTIHKQYGMIIYWILVGLNLVELVQVFRSRELA